MQALNQSKRITKEQAAYQKAKMHLLILLSLIALFLLFNFGNAFKIQVNKDIHLIKLQWQEPLARILTIDSASKQINEAKQAWDQDTLFLSLAEAKELKQMSNKRLARAIE
jgi:hypothetical protein